MIFEFFWIFFEKKNWGRARPSHLGWAKTGPAQRHVNYSAAACRIHSASNDCSSGQRGQGRDGGPPEVVRVCGRAGGEDGVFAGGYRGGGRCWSQREAENVAGERKTFTMTAPPLVNRLLVQEEGLYGGADGGEAGGGSGWWLERRGERGREKLQKRVSGGWFFFNFGLDFLLPEAINGASIYRRWKRVISSSPG